MSCRYGDEVRVYFSFGDRRSWVDMQLRDFTESALKGAIVERLDIMFGEARAKSLVGRCYTLDEVIRDGSRFNDSKSASWWD